MNSNINNSSFDNLKSNYSLIDSNQVKIVVSQLDSNDYSVDESIESNNRNQDRMNNSSDKLSSNNNTTNSYIVPIRQLEVTDRKIDDNIPNKDFNFLQSKYNSRDTNDMSQSNSIQNKIQANCIYDKDKNSKIEAEFRSPDILSIYSSKTFQPRTTGNIHAKLHFWTNSIQTAKYKWYTMPFAIFLEQLIIPSSLYYLTIGFLEMIPVLSHSHGLPVSLVPLSYVLAMSTIKGIWEELKRASADKKENQKPVLRLAKINNTKFETVPSSSLKPGDVIKVNAGNQVPADLVLLTSSDEYYIAYLNTVQLDGETNIKSKVCLSELKKYPIQNYTYILSYPLVSPVLTRFKGTLYLIAKSKENNEIRNSMFRYKYTSIYLNHIQTHNEDYYNIPSKVWYKPYSYYFYKKALKKPLDENSLIADTRNAVAKLNIGISQFVPAGTVLTNTEWITGIVVYTGNKTKIMQNTQRPRVKESFLISDYYKNAIILFLVSVTFSLLSSLLYCIDVYYRQSNSWYLSPQSYLELSSTPKGYFYAFFITFGRHLLLFAYFLPISLLLELEISSWFETYFILSDKELNGVKINTMNIIENLGSISHIFSDKTGTLTKNVMQLTSFCIDQYLYVYDKTEKKTKGNRIDNSIVENDVHERKFFKQLRENTNNIESDLRISPNIFVAFDAALVRHQILNNNVCSRESFKYFLLALSVCHTLLPHSNLIINRITEPKNIDNTKYATLLSLVQFQLLPDAKYDASSPDELALVASAKHLGLMFIKRPQDNTIELAVICENLYPIFFDSDEIEYINQQKQIYKSIPNIYVSISYTIVEVLEFDSIRKRMSVIIMNTNNTYLLLTKGAEVSIVKYAENFNTKINEILNGFAQKGLRTLMVAYRILDADTLLAFNKEMAYINDNFIEDLQAYHTAYALIENNFIVCGCTGIDDQMQDEVPETILALRNAGIKFWMLTGDKVDTAISISHSAGLINFSTYNIILTEENLEECNKKMEEAMAYILASQIALEGFESVLSNNEQTGQYFDTKQQYYSDMDANNDNKEIANNDDNKENNCCCNFNWSKYISKQKNLLNKTAKKNYQTKTSISVQQFITILREYGKKKALNTSKELQDAGKVVTQEEIEYLISVYINSFQAYKNEDKTLTSKITNIIKPDTQQTSLSVENNSKQNENKHESKTKINQQVNLSNSKYTINNLDKIIEEAAVEQYTSVSITISGESLSLILSSEESRKIFFALAYLSSAVIGCRLTPVQKAEVIQQCKCYSPKAAFASVAVGDGANDASMITEADVGIGVQGKEGNQAARTSDIAIKKFSQIRKLILCYGHTSLRRRSNMIYLIIYKNVYFAMIFFYYSFLCGHSAVAFYHSFSEQLLNILFTPWLVTAVGIFDRPINYEVLYSCSFLYPKKINAQYSIYYNQSRFLRWLYFGFFSGLIMFCLMLLINSTTVESNQFSLYIALKGMSQNIYFIFVVTSNLVIIPYTTSINWIIVLSWVFTLLSFFFVWVLIEIGNLNDDYSSIKVLYSTNLHLSNILIVLIMVSLQYIPWKYRIIFNPSPLVIMRERVKKGVFDLAVVELETGESAVVVPRQYNKYNSFAYDNSNSRFSFQRKSSSYIEDV